MTCWPPRVSPTSANTRWIPTLSSCLITSSRRPHGQGQSKEVEDQDQDEGKGHEDGLAGEEVGQEAGEEAGQGQGQAQGKTKGSGQAGRQEVGAPAGQG